MNFDYLAIETIISYKFENKSLLLQAFTHKSFSNQHRDYVSYERLEFLGDSLIGFIVADYLYKSDDEKEGVLTVKKSEMVSSVPLATVLKSLGLEKYILFGKGFNGENGNKFCEDVFEALTAAIYLDGGMAKARAFVLKTLIRSPQLKNNPEITRDYKSIIKIYFDKTGRGELTYVVADRSGPDHRPTFTIELICGEEKLSCGTGHSKQSAEQAAAKAAVYKLISEGHSIEL